MCACVRKADSADPLDPVSVDSLDLAVWVDAPVPAAVSTDSLGRLAGLS